MSRPRRLSKPSLAEPPSIGEAGLSTGAGRQTWPPEKFARLTCQPDSVEASAENLRPDGGPQAWRKGDMSDMTSTSGSGVGWLAWVIL